MHAQWLATPISSAFVLQHDTPNVEHVGFGSPWELPCVVFMDFSSFSVCDSCNEPTQEAQFLG